jgi:hypothetical protein
MLGPEQQIPGITSRQLVERGECPSLPRNGTSARFGLWRDEPAFAE